MKEYKPKIKKYIDSILTKEQYGSIETENAIHHLTESGKIIIFGKITACSISALIVPKGGDKYLNHQF